MPAQFTLTLRHDPKSWAPYEDLGDTGVGLHAAFFTALGSIDSGIATRLHDASPSGVSITPLTAQGDPGVYMTRWVLLCDEAVPAMAAAIAELSEVWVSKARFVVTEAAATYRTWESFGERATAADRWHATFRSPTLWRNSRNVPLTERREELLPSANLLLTSALDRWQAWAPLDAVPCLEPRLASDVHLVGVDSACTSTHLVAVPKKGASGPNAGPKKPVRLCGFTGSVRYRFRDPRSAETGDRESIDSVFGFIGYAGVGDFVSRGMGQVRVKSGARHRAAGQVRR